MSPNHIARDVSRLTTKILFSPHSFWSSAALEGRDWRELIWKYSLPLSVVCNGVLLTESLLIGLPTSFGRIIPPVIPTLIFHTFIACAAPLMIIVMGRCAQHFSQKLGVIAPIQRCIALMCYATTPLFAAVLFSRLPFSQWIAQLLILYSVYLAAYGSGPMLGLKREQQIIFGIGILLSSILLSILLAFIVGPLIPNPNL